MKRRLLITLICASGLIFGKLLYTAKKDKYISALHFAAYIGDHEQIKKLLEEEGVKIDAKDKKGKTAIHFATQEGNIDAAKELVEKGANVNAEDTEGRRPLHWAAARGNIQGVRFLVENGANVNAKTKKGTTALKLAEQLNKDRVVEYLKSKKKGSILGQLYKDIKKTLTKDQTLLIKAIKKGYIEEIKRLMKKGVKIDKNEALAIAAENGRLETAKFFIDKHNADVTFKDNFGQTILHKAASRGENLELIKFLIKKGAKREAKDKNGKTPGDLVSERIDNLQSKVDMMGWQESEIHRKEMSELPALAQIAAAPGAIPIVPIILLQELGKPLELYLQKKIDKLRKIARILQWG